jgi:hypothetical protein
VGADAFVAKCFSACGDVGGGHNCELDC